MDLKGCTSVVPRTTQFPDKGSRSSLPLDIQIQIIEKLGTLAHRNAFKLPRHVQRTLISLTLTSKLCYEWASPILFRHVSISISQLPELTSALCYHYRACKLSRRAVTDREIRSLRIVRDMGSNSGYHRYYSGWEKDLSYLLQHALPTLKRISLPFSIGPEICRLLSSNMDLVTTCIFHPQRSMPKLGVRTLNLVLYTDKLLRQVESPFYPTFFKGLAPAIYLRKIIIAVPDLPNHSFTLARLLVRIAQLHINLRRIVIVPRNIGRSGGMQVLAWSSLHNFKSHMKMAVDGDLEALKRLHRVIRWAVVPPCVANVHLWLTQALFDGSAWDLDYWQPWEDVLS